MNEHKQVYVLVNQSKQGNSYDERLEKLEKAHVISQPFAFIHFYVHWKMLLLAWHFGVWPEVFGQIPRLVLAMPGSWLGKAPQGNVGSTKMGIFEKANE